MEPVPRQIYYYVIEGGYCPFEDWRDHIEDHRFLDALDRRLNRIRLGLLGDHRFVGKGVMEIRFDMGPGYRLYCGEWEHRLIVLLSGGDKGSQSSDIRMAQAFWGEFRRMNL